MNPDVQSMLAHHFRRWPKINPTQGQRVVCVGHGKQGFSVDPSTHIWNKKHFLIRPIENF